MALPPGPRAPPAWQSAAWVVPPRAADGALPAPLRRRLHASSLLGQSATFVFVSDPDADQAGLHGEPGRAARRRGQQSRSSPCSATRSLLLLDGADHLRHRRLMLPPFHGERLRGYGDLMRGSPSSEIESWPTGQPLPMQPRMQAITLEIILRVVFGIARRRRRDRMSEPHRARCSRRTSKPVGFIPQCCATRTAASRRCGRSYDALDAVDEALYDEIRDRRAAPDLAEPRRHLLAAAPGARRGRATRSPTASCATS